MENNIAVVVSNSGSVRCVAPPDAVTRLCSPNYARNGLVLCSSLLTPEYINNPLPFRPWAVLVLSTSWRGRSIQWIRHDPTDSLMLKMLC